MRLTLWTSVRTGTNAPRVVLRAGQAATVGRTENADVVIAEDVQISGLHFAVDAGSDACRVRDLDSRNGTFLNGQRITQAILRDGDTLRAGGTEFRVQLESDAAGHSDQPLVRESPAPVRTGAAPVRDTGVLPTAPPAIQVEDRPPGPRIESVSLVVLGEDHSVRKLWLRPGQDLTIGSNQQADAVLSGDNRISRVHLKLECSRGVCRVRDLDSTNGTYVNGERIQEAALHQGDRLKLGETTILIGVHYEPCADGAVVSLPSYRVQPTPSGARRYEPVEARDAMRDLPLLARSTRLDVVVVASHREVVPLNGYALHEWTSQSRGLATPILVCGTPETSVIEIVQATWEKNICFGLLSKTTPQLLVAGLRLLARGQTRPTEIPNLEQMWTNACPDRLWPQLANGPPQVMTKLFSLVDAVIAPGEPPSSWRALATTTFAIALAEVGLVPQGKAP